MANLLICPVCGSTNTRPDFDFPDTMGCCESCGADFTHEGDITLDPTLIK